jgi:hypothetical protein
METNIQPNNPQEPQLEPKKNWFLRHEVLYSVISILLLVVIVGSVYWWKEIKKTEKIETPLVMEDKTDTIEGIDSDQNGIRDDIQGYIAIKYSNEPDMILVLNAYAKAAQSFIVNNSNKEESIKYDAQRGKASQCLVSIKGNDGWENP